MSLAFPLADAFSFPSIAETAPDVGERGSRVAGDLWAETGTIANVTIRGKATISESGAIRSGQTNYDNGIGFWMEAHDPASPTGNPRFSLGNSAGNKMLWTGTALQITGSITATTGTIGGWTIGATTLTGGNATLSSTGVITLGTSNDVFVASAADSTYRLWVGNATAASAPFNVTKGGALTATGVSVSGALTATSGTFSGTVSVTGSGKLQWGNDYISANLIHFELGTTIGSDKIEFKHSSDTPYFYMTGAASSTAVQSLYQAQYSSAYYSFISHSITSSASQIILQSVGNTSHATIMTMTGHGTSSSNTVQFSNDGSNTLLITPTAVNVQASGLILSGGSIHSSGASGAMPNPTKYLVLSDGSSLYYAPLFSNPAGWTA